MNVGSELFLNPRKFIKNENKYSVNRSKKRTKPTEMKLYYLLHVVNTYSHFNYATHFQDGAKNDITTTNLWHIVATATNRLIGLNYQ